MNKSYEELASEITIAWIQATGQSCANGKLAGDWLSEDSVTSFYKNTLNTIVETAKTVYTD